jgi:hypothetical protein
MYTAYNNMPKYKPIILGGPIEKPPRSLAHPVIEKNNHSIHLEISTAAYTGYKVRPEQLQSFTYAKELSDDYFCVYIDKNNRVTILGIRGTVPTNPFDLLNDLVISFKGGCNYPRVAYAASLMRKIKQRYVGYRHECTGHSLGGGVSRCLANDDSRVISISFNPACPPTRPAVTTGTNSISYHIVFDIISAWMGGGNELSVRIDTGQRPGKNLLNSLGKAHDLSQFSIGGAIITSEQENNLWQDWYHEEAPMWFVSIYQSILYNQTMTPLFIIKAQLNKHLAPLPGTLPRK